MSLEGQRKNHDEIDLIVQTCIKRYIEIQNLIIVIYNIHSLVLIKGKYIILQSLLLA